MLLELFWSFLKVGLFGIGGGLVGITLISQEVVSVKGWLTAAELNDLIAIAESTPGPFVVNGATFVGMQLGGIAGAMIATFAAILPGCLISFGLAMLYRRYQKLTLVQGVMDGLRPVIVAAIFTGGLTVMRNALFIGGALSLGAADWLSVSIFIVSFFIMQKCRVSPVLIILGGGAAGAVIRLLLGL